MDKNTVFCHTVVRFVEVSQFGHCVSPQCHWHCELHCELSPDYEPETLSDDDDDDDTSV